MRSFTFVRVANLPGLLLAVFAATISLVSVVYSVAEHASLLDSVYWAIVTATTLGYGDFAPHSGTGKVLSAMLICFTVFLLIPTITANTRSWSRRPRRSGSDVW